MATYQHVATKQFTPEPPWVSLDRRDWQLWLLAFLLIVVLGVGLLSFMFPAAFLQQDGFLAAQDRAFYGFSLLLILTLAYLVQSQSQLRELKREQWKQELVHIAFHDSLTDLPNRVLFLDRVGVCVARAKRHQDYLFAVLHMDLDRFKMINDGMGREVGDQLLVEVGRRLQSCLRATDTISRLQGDEFAILMDDIKQFNDVTRVLERVKSQLLLPTQINGHEVFTSVSIGVALSSSGYQRAEDLLRDADTAMHRAKTAGQGQHQVFDKSMHERAVRLVTLETDLRKAIERKELRLHYQPIVSLPTGLFAGFEALVRWQHPEFGLLPPAEFISIAEQSQLIVSLTRTVLREACTQAQAWKAEFPADYPISISVNLPAKYLAKPDLLQEVSGLISEHGLPPDCLRLEITEGEIMGDPTAVSDMILSLSHYGVKVYIDDFGTGYSSLSYLAHLPVHALKIDRSFVSRLDIDERNSLIVRSVVGLAQNLGLQVIAEGVETPAQLEYLKVLKCQFGQGYLFSPPCDTESAGKFLREQHGIRKEKPAEPGAFRPFNLFLGLDDGTLNEIAGICEEMTVLAGELIIHQDEVGDKLYLLREGSVGIYRGHNDPPCYQAILQAPTVFGEMAVVNQERVQTANVRAMSNVRLLAIPLPLFDVLLRRIPRLKENLLNLVAERTIR